MNRLLGQAFAVATFGVLATVLTPACADNDQSIFILSVQAPPQNRQNGACTYTNDPTQPKISYGTLDVGLADSYKAMLLVGSQLVGRGDALAGRSESNRIHINGSVVRLTDPNGGAIAEYTTLGSGFIDIQLNNVASYGLVQLDLIDATRAGQFNAEMFAQREAVGFNADLPLPTRQVVANVKLFGKTLGGQDVESGEFQFPISVCRGCSLSFDSGDDPAVAGRDCSLPLATAGGGQVVLPCRLGQDEGAPCQVCTRDVPICRGERL